MLAWLNQLDCTWFVSLAYAQYNDVLQGMWMM